MSVQQCPECGEPVDAVNIILPVHPNAPTATKGDTIDLSPDLYFCCGPCGCIPQPGWKLNFYGDHPKMEFDHSGESGIHFLEGALEEEVPADASSFQEIIEEMKGTINEMREKLASREAVPVAQDVKVGEEGTLEIVHVPLGDSVPVSQTSEPSPEAVETTPTVPTPKPKRK